MSATESTSVSLHSATTGAAELAQPTLDPLRGAVIDTYQNITAPTKVPILEKDGTLLAVQQLIITIINSNGGDLSTAHGRARTAPAPTGSTEPGRMNNDQKSVFKVSNGWSGRVSVNDARL